MTEDNNIVEFTGEWQGTEDASEMTDTEYSTAMSQLLSQVAEDELGTIVAGVLEFLTARAVIDGAFYILTDDETAITVFAANEDAKALRDALPENFKSWEDEMSVPEFTTDTDPGDEQDESAS